MSRFNKVILGVILFSCFALGISSKVIDADLWKSPDHTKTWTPPSVSDTLAGIASTQTLTNKTISGGANTLSNINLTSQITGTLPIANGGTNSTATPTAGGIGFGNGTAHAYTSAGTSNQVLYSAGSGTPTFGSAIKTNSASNTRIGFARGTCSSSSSIASSDGTMTSIGNIGSGSCNIAVTGFGSAPTCVISRTGAPGSSEFVFGAIGTSGINVSVSCVTSAIGNCTGFNFSLFCFEVQ